MKVSPPFYLRYVTPSVDKIYSYNLPAMTGTYSYFGGQSKYCGYNSKNWTTPTGEKYCDSSVFTWGRDSVFPTPFATWSIAVQDRYGCVDLSGLTEIWLTFNNVLGDTSTPDIADIEQPPGVYRNENANPGTLFNKKWSEYNSSCGAVGATLCSRSQLCNDYEVRGKFNSSMASAPENAVYVAITDVKGSTNLWAQMKPGPTFCQAVTNPTWGESTENPPQAGTFRRDFCCCNGEPLACWLSPGTCRT